MQLDLCVDFGCLFDRNLDIASTTMFLAPGMYWISGPYSSIINLHRNTMLVLKNLYVKFLWSVYTLSCRPNRIVRN